VVQTLPPQSPSATPVPINGRVLLTFDNHGQSITVPRGTIIEVALENFSYGPWSVPRSSDPKTLPRLTASSQCDPILRATFRALGNGAIEASRGNMELTQDFRVTIEVTST
jgi:hypothetical protein